MDCNEKCVIIEMLIRKRVTEVVSWSSGQDEHSQKQCSREMAVLVMGHNEELRSYESRRPPYAAAQTGSCT